MARQGTFDKLVSVFLESADVRSLFFRCLTLPIITRVILHQVNVRGAFIAMKHELAMMIQDGHDNDDGTSSLTLPSRAIINIASTAALAPFPDFAPYAASKAALLALTKTAAMEYAASGVRINAICPATTDTPMVKRFQKAWPDWQQKMNARCLGLILFFFVCSFICLFVFFCVPVLTAGRMPFHASLKLRIFSCPSGASNLFVH